MKTYQDFNKILGLSKCWQYFNEISWKLRVYLLKFLENFMKIGGIIVENSKKILIELRVHAGKTWVKLVKVLLIFSRKLLKKFEKTETLNLKEI